VNYSDSSILYEENGDKHVYIGIAIADDGAFILAAAVSSDIQDAQEIMDNYGQVVAIHPLMDLLHTMEPLEEGAKPKEPISSDADKLVRALFGGASAVSD